MSSLAAAPLASAIRTSQLKRQRMYSWASGCVFLISSLACSNADTRADKVDTAGITDLELARNPASAPQLNDIPQPVTPSAVDTAPPPAAAPTPREAPLGAAPGRMPTRLPREPKAAVAAAVVQERETAPIARKAPQVISAGTELGTTSARQLCSNTIRVGEELELTLARPIEGSNGAVVPGGATVMVNVTSLADNTIKVEPTSLRFGDQALPLEGTAIVENLATSTPRGSNAKKGAAVGALVGGIGGLLRGRNIRDVATGVVAGGAAGTAVGAATAGAVTCSGDPARVTITLRSALTVGER